MYIAPIITHKWGAGNDWKLRVQLCVLGISHKTFGLQCNSLTPIRIYHTPPLLPFQLFLVVGGVPTQTRIHDLAALASYPGWA